MNLINYNSASSAVKFLQQFTQEIKVATLSMIDNGEVSSAQSTCCEIDDNCNIWIITDKKLSGTDKLRGTLLYFDTMKNTYLYIDGIIEEILSTNDSMETSKCKQWFFYKKSLGKGLTLVRMIMKKAAYWDSISARMVPCYPEY